LFHIGPSREGVALVTPTTSSVGNGYLTNFLYNDK
jgi:hypothetical protein